MPGELATPPVSATRKMSDDSSQRVASRGGGVADKISAFAAGVAPVSKAAAAAAGEEERFTQEELMHKLDAACRVRATPAGHVAACACSAPGWGAGLTAAQQAAGTSRGLLGAAAPPRLTGPGPALQAADGSGGVHLPVSAAKALADAFSKAVADTAKLKQELEAAERSSSQGQLKPSAWARREAKYQQASAARACCCAQIVHCVVQGDWVAAPSAGRSRRP
jgi:hypothetical protein